ncbi:PAX-interacting protein 1-like isoform X2 [Anopheles bellator]|uniref:PAX-interacting protein 1-like isoform X2 n=1 Tax=Anopheles bellator TaxID=139047 RepID=UPI00264958EC|nr:PAX-interacting protein 1-like isoform X2 [Anopheles bellator]
MRFQRTPLVVACAALLVATYGADAQTRRLRVRPRVLPAAPTSAEYGDSAEADDSRPQAQGAYPQYYRAQERSGRLVLVAASDEEDYDAGAGGRGYGQPVLRARADQPYQRPAAKGTLSTAAPPVARQKTEHSNEGRAPPVQTIRNYSKVNDDGSFTFGYEAADGSFKEETRGTDCVVRGKYGYIDPDGNKREFTYVSGNPCDPNNPDGSEEDEADRAEQSDDAGGENVPQNYPARRPVPLPAARPTQPPAAARPTVATTVFQNDYQSERTRLSGGGGGSDEDSAPQQEVQIGQRGGRPVARPFAGGAVTQSVTQRPRVQLAPTTPHTVVPVNITPKPVYRASPQPTFAPTTYRPAPVVATEFGSGSTTRGPSNIDFEAEFKRFQQDNKLPSAASSTTSQPPASSLSPFGKGVPSQVAVASGNPIYQSQLIFDPASGQYDTALYQHLPQSDGDFQLNHRIQPFVSGPPKQQQHPQHHHQHLVSLEQLQQQSPLYRTAAPAPLRPPPPAVQIPQQLYQKQQNELQFINSQQLFAQQLELQQSQLRADRLEAAKKVNPGPPTPQLHRFQPPQPLQQPQPQQQQQQYYFIQPQPGSPHHQGGQIDAFLRGHNIEY